MRIYLTLLFVLFINHFILAQAPTIISFSPVSGPAGTAVTITGNNFSATVSDNIVFFGSVKGIVTTATTSSLIVTVPAGTTFQPITVTVNGLTAFSAQPFVAAFGGGGNGFTSNSFASKIEYIAGNAPVCIVSGDLDGDGNSDLIAVNDNSKTVSVFRNTSSTGTIALDSKIDFITGNSPYCVTVGDLDGDGKPDLAVANGASNTVSIFRNTSTGSGNISFAPKIDLATGNFPFCVVIGDFDGDGKPDLAAANSSSNTVSIFKNISTAGAFSFSTKVDFVTGTSPYWLAVGDLDNDGKSELAVANGAASNSVSVLRNASTTGNIFFATKIDFDGGSNSYGIASGDIDGDGKLDLIMANGVNPTVAILLNKSNGTGNISFAQKSTINTGNESYGATISDMDGDGKPDIVIANSNSNTVSVLRNKSLPGALALDPKVDFIVGTNPWVSAVVDLDGDGKPDIATANHQGARVAVLKNNVSDLRIQSFSPTDAPSGTIVTINGLNFVGITGVSFGGIPAASYTVISPNVISAVVDTGASGNLLVSRNNASAFMPGFNYLPAPLITSFSPVTAGTGDTITITGTNFNNFKTVKVGGVSALSYIVHSTNRITAVVGEGTSGYVSVTTIVGTTELSGFIYDNTPLVTSIIPSTAPVGTTISINGKHFLGTNKVTFGGVAATSFAIVSPTNLTAVVGAGATGDVVVVNTTASASLSGFTFIPPPGITSFFPVSAGPLEEVIITGNNFNGATKVTFGEVMASSFTVNSNTSISAIVAGGSSGNVKVTANGSVDSLAGFKYVSPPVPVINSFAPLSGPIGSIVTITGANFSPEVSNNIVYFGAVKAVVLTASTTSITVKAPAGTAYRPISVTTEKNLIAYSVLPFVISFPENTDSFGVSSFASKIDFISDGAKSVLINDLDGDSKPDLIVMNSYWGNAISIFKNISVDSSPIFGSKIDYAISQNLENISIGDLDGDGRPDLIASINYGESNFIWIYRNISSNGTILFKSEISLGIGSNYKGVKIGDFDGDGKPDLAFVNPNNNAFSIYKNVSTVGKMAFTAKSYILDHRVGDVAIGDLDGDQKADIIITSYDSLAISVYRNTSSIESISFANKIDFKVGGSPSTLTLGDFNGNGKLDIGVINVSDNTFSILRNTCTTGVISFQAKMNYPTISSPQCIFSGDLDGDALPELVLGSNSKGFISVYKNNSSSGNISFAPKSDYSTGVNFDFGTTPAIGDLNGDGRPDLVVANRDVNTISILRNRIGEVNQVKLCPPLANTTVISNISGSHYQWQLNTGNGYTNISNDLNYASANLAILQFSNIPSSWTGYKYRCVVDVNASEVFELRFSDSWNGTVSSEWENPANWSCGTVPDNYTDVVINSGTTIINTNVTIRSLTVNPGATITVNSGFNLKILH